MKALLSVLLAALCTLVGAWWLFSAGSAEAVAPTLSTAAAVPHKATGPAKPVVVAAEERSAVTPFAAALSGSTVHGSGLAVAGAMLVLKTRDGHELGRAESDREGRFAFGAIVAGAYTLHVQPPGPFVARQLELEIEPPPRAEVRIVLDACFELTVHVVDGSSTARPIAMAEVNLDGTEGEPQRVSRAHTDARGVARLQSIPSGKQRLRVVSPGYATHERPIHFDMEHYRTDPHLQGRPVVVGLVTTAARITGTLLGADRRRLAGALVCVDTRPVTVTPSRTRPARSTDQACPPYAISDERGQFSLHALRVPGEQRLLVCAGADDAPLLARYPLTQRQCSEGADLEIALPAARRIEVRCERADGSLGQGRVDVLDGAWIGDLEGDPLLAHVPELARWNRIERTPGRLRLGLAPGSYKVLFAAEGRAGLKAFLVTVTTQGPAIHTLLLDP